MNEVLKTAGGLVITLALYTTPQLAFYFLLRKGYLKGDVNDVRFIRELYDLNWLASTLLPVIYGVTIFGGLIQEKAESRYWFIGAFLILLNILIFSIWQIFRLDKVYLLLGGFSLVAHSLLPFFGVEVSDMKFYVDPDHKAYNERLAYTYYSHKGYLPKLGLLKGKLSRARAKELLSKGVPNV